MPEINIYGSAMVFLQCGIYSWWMIPEFNRNHKMFEFKLNITAIIIKPVIATALYVRCYVYLSNYISAILGDGFVEYLAVMCGIGMSAYVFMLFHKCNIG